MTWRPAIIGVLLGLTAPSVLAQPVRFDHFTVAQGLSSDELTWQEIEPIRLVMHQLGFGEERTEVRVAHDGQYLYLTGRMYDSDLAGVRGTSLRRDDGSMTNDWIVINLDIFNYRENTSVIVCTVTRT